MIFLFCSIASAPQAPLASLKNSGLELRMQLKGKKLCLIPQLKFQQAKQSTAVNQKKADTVWLRSRPYKTMGRGGKPSFSALWLPF